jgi:hypothetical protein
MFNKSFGSLVQALTAMSYEQENQKTYSTQKLQKYWDGLNEQEQQQVFLYVTEKLVEGLSQGTSYRDILYNIFNFDAGIFKAGQKTGLNHLIQDIAEADIVGKLDSVNRLEVIDENGRAYVNMTVEDVDISMQDNNQTLKLFVSTK